MSNKIIFLDIDGVLAVFGRFNEYNYCCRDFINPPYGCLKFNFDCVGYLNEIIARSGADIVVSSSWRCSVPIENMGQMLREQGVVGNFLDYTPYSDFGRGDEVNQWLLKHGVSHFVILDDTPYKWGELTKYWVRTNPHTGLSRDNVRLALQLLGVNDD